MLAPWYRRERTDADRLCEVIRLCEQHGWTATLQHAQEQLYHLRAGYIDHAF